MENPIISTKKSPMGTLEKSSESNPPWDSVSLAHRPLKTLVRASKIGELEGMASRPLFSTVVLFNKRIRFPWDSKEVLYKEGSLEKMGKVPLED